ncbi:MAG: 16S rRNA (uracil(1498)-N(3))-methyltransferase [Burkholderiales bacterium]|nr:16S rRNA (uracil(1498)-N(3))-methyltransferase [Burkholderiales bacterium]
MTVRLHLDAPPTAGAAYALPEAAVRHAQVRRVQPGSPLELFDGSGRVWPATVLAVGRSEVTVRVDAPLEVDRELARPVTLALGVPANERMDALVEKATELGVAAIQPLQTARSVLRLAGERAERRRAHWQAVAVAACEQCGRNRVPRIAPLLDLEDWLAQLGPAAGDRQRLLLSLDSAAAPLARVDAGRGIVALSGPEGGLSPDEQAEALRCGFVATALGPRVLRADTAPLALLAWAALGGAPAPGG